MQKKDIVELIKYHAEGDDSAFREKAYQIARLFDKNGDLQIGEYIVALMSSVNAFAPQSISENLSFFKKIPVKNQNVLLPRSISGEVLDILNAVSRGIGVNKFLFIGAPGTGKTKTAHNVAAMLERELYSVDFSTIVDSRMGQTAKNMTAMFKEIRNLVRPEKVVLLFDEIDAIALDRINSNDLREMGRVTSTLLKELDEVDDHVVIIATTNLFKNLDKALVRRFDAIVDFDRYTNDDLIDVAKNILERYILRMSDIDRDERLFRRIMQTAQKLPSPGELENLIKSCLAFSDPTDPYDYLRKLYLRINGCDDLSAEKLKKQGFTVREIGRLMGVSKSQASRELAEISA